MLFDLGFTPVITKVTRVTDHTSSLIDHIYTNTPEKVIKSGICLADISDHLPVFCTIAKGAFTRHSFWARHSKILARPAWFTPQNMSEFLQCWFLERHPWNKNATLKFVSPCTYMTAVHMLFQARFRSVRRAFAGCSKKEENIADSRVQNAIVWLVALKKWKRLSQLWDETRSSLAPLRACIKA